MILFSSSMEIKMNFIHVQDMINKFHHGISFSNTGHKMDVLMKHYLNKKRENMETSEYPYALYF